MFSVKEYTRWWKGWKKWLLVIPAALISYYFSLPEKIFKDPYSTVLQDRHQVLLSAGIAQDGQWRFPPSGEVPDKFVQALITFEDKRFFSHPGVDVRSIARAIRQNIHAGRVVSGASTISMQVIRLSRKGKSRTIFEKLIELILATRLEIRYSKEEILGLYASHAPFGGNVVGLEAACWRYFGRQKNELSWAEASLLAVLPNAPSLIHPGKNRVLLKRKRDLLLDKLVIAGKIDSFTAQLAKEEAIPDEPVPLPRMGKHLLARTIREGKGQTKVTSTLNAGLQFQVEQILNDHHQRLAANEIHNLAALVVDVKTGEVIVYAGNVNSGYTEGEDVDIIISERSTGSILKPVLYAAMMDEGKILPATLLPDIPTFINGFTPKNFTRDYDGAVSADKALIRSLNIPAVHMLRDYRYEKFHHLLTGMGITTLRKAPDHYGLSLILGGGEATLWDITGMYASMARTLENYFTLPGASKYRKTDYHPLSYIPFTEDQVLPPVEASSWVSASSIYLTFDALKELNRPGEESGWKYFESARRIAWKTGTSFGFRDGWAIGVTPEYVVGVWAGNADGEGRPGLTGTDAAAPVMFDIFSKLKGNKWFRLPTTEMEKIPVCARSGHRITPQCQETDTVWITRAGLESEPCPYHKRIHLSPNRKYQVNRQCMTDNQPLSENWFVLPPAQEYYFRSKNISYRTLPPVHPDCPSSGSVLPMEIIYPRPGSRLFIPKELVGTAGNAVFQLAHQNPEAVVFWHLDGSFIGSTSRKHHLAVNPPSGRHILTVMDDKGEVLEQSFEVLSDL